MTYASGTKVSPEQTRGEIEKTLRRYGADGFSYGYEGDRSIVAFRAHDRYVRFEVGQRPIEEFRLTPSGRVRSAGDQRRAREQEVRERWRGLLLVVKAKLESVETGIETFEEAFLPHIVLPDGGTVAQHLIPEIAKTYETGEMPSLLPGRRELTSGAA